MEIEYSQQASKFLKKQDTTTKKRIITAINKMPAGDIKKLKSRDNIYRLRVGDFRIIFDKYGKVIKIIKIDNRGQAYKD